MLVIQIDHAAALGDSDELADSGQIIPNMVQDGIGCGDIEGLVIHVGEVFSIEQEDLGKPGVSVARADQLEKTRRDVGRNRVQAKLDKAAGQVSAPAAEIERALGPVVRAYGPNRHAEPTPETILLDWIEDIAVQIVVTRRQCIMHRDVVADLMALRHRQGSSVGALAAETSGRAQWRQLRDFGRGISGSRANPKTLVECYA
jgi:hypothetical protein